MSATASIEHGVRAYRKGCRCAECRAGQREYVQERRKRNPEKFAQYNKNKKRNPEKAAQWNKEWRKRNPDKVRASAAKARKQWNKTHPEEAARRYAAYLQRREDRGQQQAEHRPYRDRISDALRDWPGDDE